ncbi:MAG: ABC transporter permease subunit [Ignavibacteriales bacterium]|nr:ABC transporter permease subunit [Ignavibacteriales bacterium]
MKALSLSLLTIREAILKGTLLFYFIVGNLIILFFAAAVSGSMESGTLTITMFGSQLTPRGLEGFNPVEFLLRQLFQSASSAIMLFGIFATAGLIPSMLEKGTVELYLSKPLSRSSLLLARSFGACGGIGANILYFAVGIWAVFGIKTGIWHGNFLLASVVAIFIFLCYYSVVALTAVITRSTAFSIMIAFVFTLFSSALEVRQTTLYVWWENAFFHRFLDSLYYATPRISRMIDQAANLVGKDITTRVLAEQASAGFDILPFVYSFLSASLLYALAIVYFFRQDY